MNAPRALLLSLLLAACGGPEEPPPSEPAPAEPAALEAEPAAPAEPAQEELCAGSAAGCYHRAVQLIAGTESPDPARGWAMTRRACQLGYGTACYDLAIAHVNGNEHVASDIAEYLRLVELACEGGSPDGCNELATPPRELRRSCAQGFREHCALLEHLRARD